MRNFSTFTVRFYLKDQQLMCRIRTQTIATFSTGLFVDPSKWLQKDQIVTGRDIQRINIQIGQIRSKLIDCYSELSEQLDYIDSKSIINRFKNLSDGVMISDIIQKFITIRAVDISTGSLSHFNNLKKKVIAFNDVPADNINVKYCTDLMVWLKSPRKDFEPLSHNSACGIIKKLKQVVRFAKRNEMVKHNKIEHYKLSLVSKQIEFLTLNEIKILTEKDLTGRLARVRDVFLFQCWTAMEYSRVKGLKMSMVGRSIHYDNVVFTSRDKTNENAIIPLLPQAMQLLNKYEGHRCRYTDIAFPVITNQKMNGYLKEIADICGINKRLHTHLARHTFATLAINYGMRESMICAVMGLADARTLKRYYGVVLSKGVSDDMKVFENKLKAIG